MGTVPTTVRVTLSLWDCYGNRGKENVSEMEMYHNGNIMVSLKEENLRGTLSISSAQVYGYCMVTVSTTNCNGGYDLVC